MAQRQDSDLATDARLGLEQSISMYDADEEPRGIERVRSAVNLTKEAARVISITAVSYTHLTLPTIYSV